MNFKSKDIDSKKLDKKVMDKFVAPTIRCWIYTDDEKKDKVLFSDLSEQEQREIRIALNVQAMKQAGYERTDNIQ